MSSSNKQYIPNLQGHLPVLDGVRGIAILLVLLVHTTVMRAGTKLDDWYFMFGKSGWIGVDLFFVLSGFLITGILVDAKGGRHFFRNFYARRILRIFPLYYLVVVFALFLVPHIPHEFAKSLPDHRPAHWWYWLYCSNFYAAINGKLGHIILGPAWSLAIEEQFYLVWPLLVFLLSRARLMQLCVAIIIFSYYLRHGMYDSGYERISVYVATISRLDGLAAGAWVALAVRGPGGFLAWRNLARAIFWLSGAFFTYLLLNGYVHNGKELMIRYGYTAAALFFGSCLYYALLLAPQKRLYRLLTCAPLLILGKYSYAIYLFNRPLTNVVSHFMFAPREVPRIYGSLIPGQLLFTLTVTLISLGLALISWHLFEKHFLKLKRYFPAEKPAVDGEAALVRERPGFAAFSKPAAIPASIN